MVTDHWSRKSARSARKRRPPSEAEIQEVAKILTNLHFARASGGSPRPIDGRPLSAYLPDQQLLAQYERCASDVWLGREHRGAAALRANAIRAKVGTDIRSA
jgi:hypothetical protein